MVKIQDRKFISVDHEKCVGCQICEYMCSWTKEKVFNPTKSRIRVVRVNQIANMAINCRRCEAPLCVSACPRNALTESEESGTIYVDENKCNGCGWCIEACDYGAVMLHADSKIVYICDLCENEKGGPQCVKWCPEEALEVATSATLAQKARMSAVKKLFQNRIET